MAYWQMKACAMQTKELILVVVVMLGLGVGISLAVLTQEAWLLPLGTLIGMIIALVVQNLLRR